MPAPGREATRFLQLTVALAFLVEWQAFRDSMPQRGSAMRLPKGFGLMSVGVIALVLAMFVQDAAAQMRPFVIFGDSISAGGNATRGNRTYAARLARKTTKYSILNYSRDAWSVCGSEWLVSPAYVQGVTALWPAAVLIALGTNDYSVGSSLEDFRTYYRTILAGAGAWPFGADKVFCLTPFPRANEELPNAAGLVLDDYRLAIEQECEEMGGRVLDGRAMLPSSPAYLQDGLHPNDRGHAEIARQLMKALGDEMR